MASLTAPSAPSPRSTPSPSCPAPTRSAPVARTRWRPPPGSPTATGTTTRCGRCARRSSRSQGCSRRRGSTLREDEAAALLELVGADEPTVAQMLLLTADQFVTGSSTGWGSTSGRSCWSGSGCMDSGSRLRPCAPAPCGTRPSCPQLLVQISGLAELRRLVADHLMPRATVLKARMVLAGLRDLARRLTPADPGGSERILAAIERLEAGSHEFAELRLAHLALTGSLRFSPDELAEVDRLARGGPAATPASASPRTRRSTTCAPPRWPPSSDGGRGPRIRLRIRSPPTPRERWPGATRRPGPADLALTLRHPSSADGSSTAAASGGASRWVSSTGAASAGAAWTSITGAGSAAGGSAWWVSATGSGSGSAGFWSAGIVAAGAPRTSLRHAVGACGHGQRGRLRVQNGRGAEDIVRGTGSRERGTQTRRTRCWRVAPARMRRRRGRARWKAPRAPSPEPRDGC